MAADEPTEETSSPRPARASKLWSDVRIDPVEIALPGGVGYTLRAYRLASEVTKTPAIDRPEELDDFDAAAAAVASSRRVADDDESEDADQEDADQDDTDDAAATAKELRDRRAAGARSGRAGRDEELDEEFEGEFSEEDFADEDEAEGEEEAGADEEIPLFLARNGRVLLFRDKQKLVDFVRSGEENDLDQLDSWPDLVKKIESDDVVPLQEDTYELDLVVENLRGGPDAWDPPLILKAGEVARDLGYALRIEPVLIALAAGSPLDDLDEALRAVESGGIGSFFAKRRLRKIPAQQSSLAWRTIIGKISTATEWRD